MNNGIEERFAERLAQLRANRGVSARDMSLSLGQSESYINMIENKRTFPAMQPFFYICEYLEIEPKDFFDYDSQDPALINAVMDDLKKLDAQELAQVAALVKTMASKSGK